MSVIYGLTEPDGAVRYVGYAVDAQRRFDWHWSEGRRRTHKSCWLASLRDAGFRPGLVILEVLDANEDWRPRERWWIAELRQQGCDLTNGTDGGEGGHIPAAQTPEARAKRAASHRGQKRSAEFCAANAARQVGVPRSEATKAKIREARARQVGVRAPGAKLTEEQVRSIRRLRAEGVSGTEVALQFGITPARVSQIHRRLAWAHLPEEQSPWR